MRRQKRTAPSEQSFFVISARIIPVWRIWQAAGSGGIPVYFGMTCIFLPDSIDFSPKNRYTIPRVLCVVPNAQRAQGGIAMHDSPGSVVTQLCSGLQLYSAERRIADCILADVKWASVATSAEARKRPPNDPLHQALLDLQNNRQEEVQATIQALNLVQLRKVLSILRAAEIIEIEANGSSLPVAMDASLKLGSLGKRCMISPVPEKARSFASALTPKDALLLISSAGRCEALETAARAAKKNGTPVILITCDKRSALAGHASYTLLASNRIQRIASDMMPSQLSAALVVEALYYLLVGNFDLN